jgi:predicted GIY-YIG superfamily endonuclease
MSEKQPIVYMLANKKNGTIYVGVTSDLGRRLTAHTSGNMEGFTQKYGVKTLVYVEVYETMDEAIMREKQLKAGSRKKKVELIKKNNPEWVDISEKI